MQQLGDEDLEGFKLSAEQREAVRKLQSKFDGQELLECFFAFVYRDVEGFLTRVNNKDLQPRGQEEIKQLRVSERVRLGSLLVRFLVAREWDLDKSEKLLKSCIDYRKKMELDRILFKGEPEKLQLFNRIYGYGFHGFTKKGEIGAFVESE